MKTSLSCPLLITAAMKEELFPLVDEFKGKPLDISGLENVFSAEMEGKTLFFIVTGVGKKQVRYRLKKALPILQPKAILSIGTAGGIDPSFEVGDAILSKRVCSQSSQDVTIDFSPNELVRNDVVNTLSIKVADCILTVNSALGKEEKKAFAGGKIGLVDMETWHIAKVTHEIQPGTQILSLRTISDSFDMELPSPEELSGKKAPKDIARFRRHKRNIEEAIKANCTFASSFIRSSI